MTNSKICWIDFGLPPLNLWNMPKTEYKTLYENCIEFKGSKDEAGYGLKTVNGKTRRVTRLVWEHYNGEIPPKMFVCHTCDNPSCINPFHLFLGTNSDNMKDMYAKGRGNNFFKDKNPLRKLTKEQVAEIKNLLANGITQQEIANMFKVDRTLISQIKLGKIWTNQ